MDDRTIEITGIPEPLLKLLDERVRQKGGDRVAYIRDLIERDIYSVSAQRSAISISERQKQSPFNPKAWEADMKALAERAEEMPILPLEAFTRESIYGNHD